MARKAGSHADITGPAIHDAALRLFSRSGYAAVSMREIASEVGVRAGALYLYTPDKQTLLFDLMRDHLETLLANWDVAKSGDTPLERLRAFVDFHVEYHFELRDKVMVSYMELRNLSEDNFLVIQKLRRSYEDRLEGILKAGQESEVFQFEDVRVTTMALLAMLSGYITWYQSGGRLDKDDIKRIHWDLARAMVGA
ncbi:MAG: TetR/AcrR family transcriptional regulator [Silicimonas sp.]|nr:TetR/AcrR family transcriptional regulator [Silicimonas sp.]